MNAAESNPWKEGTKVVTPDICTDPMIFRQWRFRPWPPRRIEWREPCGMCRTCINRYLDLDSDG